LIASLLEINQRVAPQPSFVMLRNEASYSNPAECILKIRSFVPQDDKSLLI